MPVWSGADEVVSIELPIPPDWREASHVSNLACGHGALAAALGIGAWEAFGLLGSKEGWVNMPMMEAALQASRRRWRRLRPQERFGAAAGGVVMVQFLGSWMEAGNPYAACRYRHWAATRNGLVWDVNWPDAWLTKPAWVCRMIAELLPTVKRATGWDVIGKWEVEAMWNHECGMTNDQQTKLL